MIFAAGLGTRLRPFTLSHPKALVPVDGKPVLQRAIENIAKAGIDNIVINVHHFAPQIVEFLKAHDNFGLNISVSDESDLLLDTGGGLLKARGLFGEEDDDILLHNADVVTDFPLTDMIKAHLADRRDVTLLCSERHSSRSLFFRKDNDELAGWMNHSTGETKPTGFSPDGELYSESPFNGIHIVNSRIFAPLAEYAECNYNGEIMPFSIVPFYLSMIGRLSMKRFLLPGGYRWFDIGSPEKLAAADAAFRGV